MRPKSRRQVKSKPNCCDPGRSIAVAIGVMFWLVSCSAAVTVPPATPTPGRTTTTTPPPPPSPSATILNILRQQEFTVRADLGWQSADILLLPGDQVTLQIVSGQWTPAINKAPFIDGAGKYGVICANSKPANQCGEPIPDYPTGALIARIDTMLIRVGALHTTTAATSSRLQFRMNDADTSLSDNAGQLIVQITIRRSPMPAPPSAIPAR